MSWNWNDAPGSSPSHRRKATLRKLFTSLLVGMLSVGVAWAGTGLVPINDTGVTSSDTDDGNWLQSLAGDGDSDGGSASAAAAGTDEPLQANQVYAGAHAVNIAPNPAKYNGEWEKDQDHCQTNAAPIGFGNPQETEPEHLADTRVRWNENINCIYTGGFDIGPAHAVSSFDEEFGLYARATAISDGNDTVVLMILDGAYYFAEYANMCNTVVDHASDFDGEGPGANQYTQDCGFRQMAESMAAKYGFTGADARGEHGIEPSSFFLASSHAHASPDFVGAWGGVPRWYMQQVEDAIRQAVYTAIDTMQPTYVEASEILYRAGNNSRRRHYHAAEEAGYAWMRFVAEEDAEPVCTTPPPSPAPSPTKPKGKPSPSPTATPTPTPSCTQPPPNKRAVATIGTYAAHPTDGSGGRAYGDLSAVYAKRAEARFGGTGLYFQTGFGNMTSGPGRVQLAGNLVDMLPAVGAGPQVTGNLDVRTALRTFNHPVTNSALGGGGITGIFDRPMGEGPAAVSISRDSLGVDAGHMPYKRCNSASPVSVNTSVSVARVGNLLVTGGPGELFSNYTNTIKEKHAGGLAFPLSLVNDGLGYIMQSVETDHVGRQAVGFVNGPLSEYEDAYSIDACFGDHALEQTLAGMDGL
ncbi:MAG TPA: hypothetical protein VNP73_12240 [Actinomycetota bacterium]|nr:hypothetical protein [Actinomycetota bacterium]